MKTMDLQTMYVYESMQVNPLLRQFSKFSSVSMKLDNLIRGRPPTSIKKDLQEAVEKKNLLKTVIELTS